MADFENDFEGEQLSKLVIEITYELGNKFWHTNCRVGLQCGIMVAVEHATDHSVIECLHCGQRGRYPVGGVGPRCSPVLAGDPVPRVAPETAANVEKALEFMVSEYKRVGYVQSDEDAPKTFPVPRVVRGRET